MNAFTIPQTLVNREELPPPILTSEPGSFAQYTLRERVPAILQETARLNPFPEEIREAFQELLAEITKGGTRPLREEAPDRAFWNTVSASHFGRGWLDVPWYWAEAYFYRRILEAARYFQPGAWQGVDPFGPKKATELAPDAAPRAVQALLSCLPEARRARFEAVLYASLWGNRTDLSYEVAARLGRPTGDRDERSNLLVDDTTALWNHFQSGQGRRVAILADNAGTELLMDLVLVEHLLTRSLADEIQLHVKPQPFFVSDATAQDVRDGLEALGQEGGVAHDLATRLRLHVAERRLRVVTHWHYATSLFFFELPEDLHCTLANADLVIVKGDANYRRLLGDARWPHTTPFAHAIRYFPSPLVVLRTLKAEIIVGLQPGQAEQLQAEDPAWLVNGKRGIIQARL